MAKDTKERILSAALDLFSRNGYAGTNIRELTASLGLVKSSMYKHFKSKEEIWNGLLDEMIVYYGARFGSPERLPPVPDSLEGLVTMTMQMVHFTVHDENVVKTRKLLTIEQFRDERARALATKHFLTGLKDMFTPIFAGMMDKGLLRRDDPAMLAFAYTAPISALIHLCDREPEKTDAATAQIEAFSRHFIEVYGVKMNKYTAYCGLDCESCEARIATVNNDDALRRKVAARWSELNGVEITPDMIHCAGCRIDGVKTPYCDSLCPIRACAREKQVETCGACAEMRTCEKLGAITRNNPDALGRLESAR